MDKKQLEALVFEFAAYSDISRTTHLVNVARVLKLTESNRVRVEYWWRFRQSDIEFDIRAVERIESFFCA